jgi:nucleotide-binding universal stress UspA family protein
MRSYESILVPTDFSPGARAALDHALELARRCGGRVTLLHVYEIPAIAMGEGSTLGTGLLQALEAGARQGLANLLEEIRESRVPIDTKVMQGPPALAIVDYAREHDADLIVMGTHGRTGFKRFARGQRRGARRPPRELSRAHGAGTKEARELTHAER